MLPLNRKNQVWLRIPGGAGGERAGIEKTVAVTTLSIWQMRSHERFTKKWLVDDVAHQSHIDRWARKG